MEKSNYLNEALLASWLRLSTSINNSRLVNEMTFNESLVCGLLYKHKMREGDKPLTATDLCQFTKMLKSQMNRTLNNLEARDMITRERSSQDKRLVYVSLNMEQAKAYEKQHAQILTLLDQIIAELGPEKALEAIHLFNEVSDIADRLFTVKGGKHD